MSRVASPDLQESEMDASNIEMVKGFLVMLGVTLFVVIIVCWIWLLATSLRVKTRKVKMRKDIMELKGSIGQPFMGAFTGIIDNMTDEIRCYRCGARSPAHYHGCPYAAQWCIETIAKP